MGMPTQSRIGGGWSRTHGVAARWWPKLYTGASCEQGQERACLTVGIIEVATGKAFVGGIRFDPAQESQRKPCRSLVSVGLHAEWENDWTSIQQPLSKPSDKPRWVMDRSLALSATNKFRPLLRTLCTYMESLSTRRPLGELAVETV